MRLIDADALIEHLARCIEQSKGLMRSVCVAIKCFVEQMPTIETTPVVHGRWIGPTRVDANNNKYECSECGFWGVPGWVACPYCGARMEVGNNGKT